MHVSFLRFLRGSVFSLAIVFPLVLGSCQYAKNQMQFDRSADLSDQNVKDILAPNTLPPEDEDDDGMPDLMPVVATPEEMKLPSPLVTVSVNQTVALRDLLFELADQADIDIELDPQIRGSLIFTAKNRPFNEVVDRLCEMAGLRYTFNKDVLRVELDRPYTKNYMLDYISATRSGSGGSSVNVEASSDSDAGATADGGSSFSVDTTMKGDIWAELQTSLEQLLTTSDTYVPLATMSTPAPVAVMPTAAPADPNAPVDPNAPPALPANPNAPPVLNVMNAVSDPVIPNAPATFSINRQTGIVSVFASQRQQKAVETFLNQFRARATTQVLIEARVLQVDLTDEFSMGVDWEAMNVTGLLNISTSMPMPALTPQQSGAFTATLRTGNDLNMAVSALNRFGTVRALSSPRVTVLNSQVALFKVTQTLVYFEFDTEVETNDETNTRTRTITVDSEIKRVPDGIMMSVMPTANPETGEILLVVRPTIARVADYVEDPTVAFTLAANGLDPSAAPANQIPRMTVQEIDSVLRLQSGQVVVMGGLMRDSNTVERQQVPVLGSLPFIGGAFRMHSDRVEKSELVILLRAQIIPGSNVDQMDRKLYEQMGQDRRPVRL